MAQMLGPLVFEDAPSYSLFTAAMDGDMDISETALDDFATAAALATDPVEAWTRFAQFLAYTKGLDNISVGEEAPLDQAVDDTNEATLTDWADVVNTMYANLGAIIDGPEDWASVQIGYGETIINGTSGVDTLTAPDNTTHWIKGFEGNDTLTGGSGADKIEGGGGNDTFVDNDISRL